MCLVQVHVLATLAAAVRDFYGDFEDDPGGSGYLRLELRAWVCGAWAVEVVVGSGGGATAFLCYRGGGCPVMCPVPSRAIQTLCVMCVRLPYMKIRLSLKVMILESRSESFLKAGKANCM